MKLNPNYYQERSTGWYGKNGLSWHGTVVIYQVTKVLEEKPLDAENKSFRNMYIDDIYRNNTDQNAYSVASILELVCYKVSKEVPSIKKQFIIESDNAGKYSNSLLPVIAPFIFEEYALIPNIFLHRKT